jgi:hypothetical protein
MKQVEPIEIQLIFLRKEKKKFLSLHPLLEGRPEGDFRKEAKEAIFRRITYTFKDKAAYTRVLYMGKNIRNTLVPVQ